MIDLYHNRVFIPFLCYIPQKRVQTRFKGVRFMKRHLHVFLFVVMLALLLGVTVLAVSAAGEWKLYATQADADSDATPISSHDTIAEAVAAVSADGQVVKLTADITDSTAATPAHTLTNTHVYTVDGGDHVITADASTSGQQYIAISGTTVTFKNLTINRTYYRGSIFRFDNALTITLDGVKMTKSDTTLNFNSKPVKLTIKGDSAISGYDTRIGHLANATGNSAGNLGLIKFEGGTFTIAKAGFTGAGAMIWITGGTFNITGSAPFIQHADNAWGSPVRIDGGTFNLSGAGATVVDSSGNTGDGSTFPSFHSGYYSAGTSPAGIAMATHAVVEITGGEFNLSSTGSVIYTHIANNKTVRSGSAFTAADHPIYLISGGTFGGGTSASTKGAVLYDESNPGIDASPVYNVTGGTFGNCAQWIHAAGSAVFNVGTPGSENNTAPSFNSNVSSSGWGLFTMRNNSGANRGKLNIYSGTFTYTGTRQMIHGAGGSVLIAGGVFNVARNTFYAGDRDVLSPLRITGGDFTMNSGAYPIICYGYDQTDDPQGVRADKDQCGQIADTDWAYGNTFLKIEGGNFHVNATGGFAIYTIFNVVKVKNTAGAMPTDATAVCVEITGGTFDTSTNDIESFITDGHTGSRGRFTVAEDGVNPTLNVTYNISGTASFTGGCAWIKFKDNTIDRRSAELRCRGTDLFRLP